MESKKIEFWEWVKLIPTPPKTKQEQWKKIHTDRLKKRLKAHGLMFSPNNIPLDGNCLFAAVTDQVDGNPNNHRVIRASTVKWLRDNEAHQTTWLEKLSDFIFDETFESYCDKMATEGTWGGHIAICLVTFTGYGD